MFSVKKVLILVPHLDDGELGCGGTIAKFIEEGKSVHHVAFSIPSRVSPNIIKIENKKAREFLGIRDENFVLSNYKVRNFPSHRQEILEDMIKLRKDINPDIVFLPSLQDLHQDHKIIAEEGLRAFKYTTILGWEQPWNHIAYSTSCFIMLNSGQIEKKIKAIRCYESQMNDRIYFSDEFLRGFARTRGGQINVEYAEAFEVIRWLVR